MLHVVFLFSFTGNLYVRGSGSITLVRGDRAIKFVCYGLLVIIRFLLERFPLPLAAWDGLRSFIVALHKPSI